MPGTCRSPNHTNNPFGQGLRGPHGCPSHVTDNWVQNTKGQAISRPGSPPPLAKQSSTLPGVQSGPRHARAGAGHTPSHRWLPSRHPCLSLLFSEDHNKDSGRKTAPSAPHCAPGLPEGSLSQGAAQALGDPHGAETRFSLTSSLEVKHLSIRFSDSSKYQPQWVMLCDSPSVRSARDLASTVPHGPKAQRKHTHADRSAR